MTKIVVASINSKYIHLNLAIRYIQKYLAKIAPKQEIVIKEWNIKQKFTDILRELYDEKPDMVLFSVYIWNVEMTFKLIKEFKKLLPETVVAVGGPEVMYRKDSILSDYPEIDAVLVGDGEIAVTEYLGFKPELSDGCSLDYIPFPYDDADIEQSRNQIIYYESSRGCPFSCAYCMSSIESKVRYFSFERVINDINYFMQRKVKLVKFVDRTFNLDRERYYPIWENIIKNHNEKTTFHFEISGDLLTKEDLALLKNAPQNAIQLEAGVQSSHLPTLKAINRTTDLNKLKSNMLEIGENIHLHVDLIAGLPFEDFETFEKSFDYAMSLKPDMLQLGFLKILNGTEMEKFAKSNHDYLYLSAPPYEVISTPWLSYEDVCLLKDIDKTVDIYYNSGRHKTPQVSFAFFKEFSLYLRNSGVYTDPRSPDYYAKALNEYLKIL